MQSIVTDSFESSEACFFSGSFELVVIRRSLVSYRQPAQPEAGSTATDRQGERQAKASTATASQHNSKLSPPVSA